MYIDLSEVWFYLCFSCDIQWYNKGLPVASVDPPVSPHILEGLTALSQYQEQVTDVGARHVVAQSEADLSLVLQLGRQQAIGGDMQERKTH